MFWLILLHQIFSKLCFYLQDFIKIVRLLLAAVSINGLNEKCLKVIVPVFSTKTSDSNIKHGKVPHQLTLAEAAKIFENHPNPVMWVFN